jgi:hypothetical protein
MRFKKFITENQNGIHVRDTFVSFKELEDNPNKQQIMNLVDEYKKIPYIEARTEIGPDQWARTSEKRRQEIQNNASKVFAIEMKIKQLLKKQDVVDNEKKEARIKEIEGQLLQKKRYIEQVESLGKMSHKDNGKLKISYQRAVDDHSEQIKKLEDELKTLK